MTFFAQASSVGGGATAGVSLVGLLVLGFLLGIFVLFFVALWNKKYGVVVACGLLMSLLIFVPLLLLFSWRATSVNAPSESVTALRQRQQTKPLSSSVDYDEVLEAYREDRSPRIDNPPIDVAAPIDNPPKDMERTSQGELRSWTEVGNRQGRAVVQSDRNGPHTHPHVFRWTNIDDGLGKRWQDLEKTPFVADIYPALRLTARPAATQLKQSLDEKGLTPSSEEPGKRFGIIHVNADAIMEQHREAIAIPFLAQLRDEYPGVKIERGKVSDDVADVLTVRIIVEGQKSSTSVWNEQHHLRRGTLVVQASWKHEKFAVDARIPCRFVEEMTWVTDFASFQRDHPKNRYVIGYSADFMSSEIAARKSAIGHAQSKFMIDNVRGLSGPAAENFVVDVFSQELSRPYGDVWRSAVLLDVSDEAIAPFAAVAQTRAQLVQDRRFSAGTGLLVLLTMTVLIGFSMNAFTQGYYRGWLTTGGAIAVLGLVAILFVMNLV